MNEHPHRRGRCLIACLALLAQSVLALEIDGETTCNEAGVRVWTPPSTCTLVADWDTSGHATVSTTASVTFVIAPGVRLANGTTLFAAGPVINFGRVVNSAFMATGDFLSNDGDFINAGTGTLANEAGLTNLGRFDNAGGVIDSFVGRNHILNAGSFINSGGVLRAMLGNAIGARLINLGGFELVQFEPGATSHNLGEIVNEFGATVDLEGPLRNFGGALVRNAGSLRMRAGPTLGGIDNELGAEIRNELLATITLNDVLAYLNNRGLIANSGAIANGGIVNNLGVICGPGTLTGNLVIGIAPVPSCLVAHAGPDQSVGEGQAVTLDGTASSAPMGGSLSFVWTQVGGPAVSLAGADTATPGFTSPFVAANQVLTFSLVVSDGLSASLPDTVDVIVRQTNSPPVADAGNDATAKPGVVVTLDGSRSFDPDGDATLQFEWTQVYGPLVALSPGPGVANPSFTVPSHVGAALVFKLRVSDGLESSVPSVGLDSSLADTVAIAIVDNSRPVAAAGLDQSVPEGSFVLLDGGGSFDSDAGDMLSYEWRQIGGVAVTLMNPTTPTPSFIAPMVPAGTNTALTFQLVVRDNDPVHPLASLPDTVDILVQDVRDPPRCDLAAPTQDQLWPPDGRFSTVGIIGVDDPARGIVLRITGVRQDEPVGGLNGGDSSPDALIAGSSDSVQLRRERAVPGNGRVYSVAFAASDGTASCSGEVRVGVPVARPKAAIDDGPRFDSTAR